MSQTEPSNQSQTQLPTEALASTTTHDALEHARKRTWHAIQAIQANIHPGMSEKAAVNLAQKTLSDMGVRKFWHKCHVRFGKSTVLSFDDPYHDEVILQEQDIYFIDLGPVWDGIEGDAGCTFQTGSHPEHTKIRRDVEQLFFDLKHLWQTQKLSGQALYAKAEDLAKKMGWVYGPSYVRGHRISEFPHALYTKAGLGEQAFCPSAHRWILEVQIRSPDSRFGAFYEDIL